MRFPLVLVAALTLTVGCSRGGGAPRSTPVFDQRWTTLAQRGAEAFYIQDNGGEALMGNVLQAQGGVLQMAPTLANSFKGGTRSAALPDQPKPDEVQHTIRQYLPGVKSCYLRMTRDGDTRSGKAIVSFQIAGTGRVQSLNVEAPAFEGTALPSCISGQVERWVFPPSRKGAGAVSYPFVFASE